MAEGTTLSNLLPPSSVVLHELIGEGGYSKVWRATYTNMAGEEFQAAAKKVVSGSVEDKEIRNMQKMNHENIVKFYGVWMATDGNVYIIMELAKKGDLRKFLEKCNKEHTRPTAKCILKWTYQAACALQYLKRLNLSHRDIKSLNFLLTEDYTLKLGDLGLATQLYETQFTQKRGTTHWVAPEVYSDAKRSPKSDLFSFAMVIWEIISTDIPYADCNGEFQVMRAILAGKRPMIPDHCPDVLRPFLIQCWDADRTKRPDIDVFCQTLLHYQCTVKDHVEPVKSSEPGIPTQETAPPTDDADKKSAGPIPVDTDEKKPQQVEEDVEKEMKELLLTDSTGKTKDGQDTGKTVKPKPSSIRRQLLGLPKAKVYQMKHNPHGLCVIINNVDFSEARATVHKAFTDREGSKVDADNLETLFKSLHYKVESHFDLTAHKIYELLQEKRKSDHSQYDCFVCCILTHGRNSKLYGCDGKKVNILDLTGVFKATLCPSLAGKPKFFIFEACQGDESQGFVTVQHDGPPAQIESIPDEDDFVLGYATVPRQVAYRCPIEGSWYINALVDTIKKAYRDHDLLLLLGMVNDRMKLFENDDLKQTSSVFSTLRKQLFLNDHQGEESAGAALKQFKTV